MARSRRKAREAALKALYKIEVAKCPIAVAVEEMLANSELGKEISLYAESVVRDVRENQAMLDQRLSAVILEYDYDRLAMVDRNVLRIAAYELLLEPSIPPAVTINEAIEISRKYSTFESGKFVNGVLGKLLTQSPKANWDPSTAPPEGPEEIVHDEEPMEITEETIEANSEEAKKLAKIGGWTLRPE